MSNSKGSSLMAVIIITGASLTIIGATTILISLILYSMSGWQHSIYANIVAESMAEDAMLRLIRDPEWTPDPADSLMLNGATAHITHTPSPDAHAPHTLQVRGISGTYVKNIKIEYFMNHHKPTVVSWQTID